MASESSVVHTQTEQVKTAALRANGDFHRFRLREVIIVGVLNHAAHDAVDIDVDETVQT